MPIILEIWETEQKDYEFKNSLTFLKINIYIKIFKQLKNILKMVGKGPHWRDGSVVKSGCCSFRGPKFGS